MRVEPVAADLAGTWGAIVITSANALQAVPATADGANNAAGVCRRRSQRRGSAAGGICRGQFRGRRCQRSGAIIAERAAGAKAPLLYLAGEDRAGDLVAQLAAHGIAAEMKVVYRAVAAPFRRSWLPRLKPAMSTPCCIFPGAAPNSLLTAPGRQASPARREAVRHLCLSCADCRAARRREPHCRRCPPGRGSFDRAFAGPAGLIVACKGQLRYFLSGGVEPISSKEARMADKRTTPDPAEGARRRKRPAPTIDLTATEVSASSPDHEAHAAEPPPRDEHPSTEAPEPAAESPASNGAKPWNWAAARQMFFAGLGGAAIVALVFLGVSAGGACACPPRQSCRCGGRLRLQALNERLAQRIESLHCQKPRRAIRAFPNGCRRPTMP